MKWKIMPVSTSEGANVTETGFPLCTPVPASVTRDFIVV
jgi:hypothetical protein